MYFRFGLALCLVVAISILGIAIEKENLRLRQQITRQHFRMGVMEEKLAVARAEMQQAGAPPRLLQSLEEGRIGLSTTETPGRLASTPPEESHR